MRMTHTRGYRAGYRGHPPHGWREPPGTQTPLSQASAIALPSPLSSRHCLRLLADGPVMQAEGSLVEAVTTGCHSKRLLQLPLRGPNPAKTMLASCSAPALLMSTGDPSGAHLHSACATQHPVSLKACAVHSDLSVGSRLVKR